MTIEDKEEDLNQSSSCNNCGLNHKIKPWDMNDELFKKELFVILTHLFPIYLHTILQHSPQFTPESLSELKERLKNNNLQVEFEVIFLKKNPPQDQSTETQ